MSKKELETIFGREETLNDLISLFEKRFSSNETIIQRNVKQPIESIDDIDIYLNV